MGYEAPCAAESLDTDQCLPELEDSLLNSVPSPGALHDTE